MTRRAIPNYMRVLLAREQLLPSPGGVHHVMVLHDDWCAFLKLGTAANCNCTPSIVSGPEIDARYETNSARSSQESAK